MTLLRRLEGSRLSVVERAWEGKVAVLLGGGASLTHEQVVHVAAAHALGLVRCVAINDAYLLAPWADLLYFADAHWWRWQREGVAKEALDLSAEQVRERFAAFVGEICSIAFNEKSVTDNRVRFLRNLHGSVLGGGLSLEPTAIATGWNSGSQALNIATLAGAHVVLLLGFDGRPNAQGQTHWFGEHPRATPQAFWEQMRRGMRAMESALKEQSVRVVNCSPGTYIDTFEKMELEGALKQFAYAAVAG